MRLKSTIFIVLTICSFIAFNCHASSEGVDKPTSITVGSTGVSNAIVTLVVENVGFYPSLGIGLSDIEYETIATINFKDIQNDRVELSIKEPKMVRLQFVGNGRNRTYMLFMQPGDNLVVMFSANNDVAFAGTNANYQVFLSTHFLENHYQYLPVFGYKPYAIESKTVVHQSDSLKNLRTAAYAKFKTEATPVPAFDAYVTATTFTEPLVIRNLMAERIMRKNKVTKLDPAQRKELEDLTLTDFKILSDDALLSKAYRDELRNWALIPSTRKFPLDENSRYEISPAALKDVFAYSKEKLASNPRQQEYLLTYWLNYAVTATPEVETGKTLLADFQSTFPQSPFIKYFSDLIKTKESLSPGQNLPELTMLGMDSTAVAVSTLKKPMVMVFAFSIGQHEPSLKVLEEKYKDKVTFAYVSVVPGLPFGTLKQYTKDRADAKHYWVSDETIDLLKQRYAIDIRYPFLVTDASGKIVNRWIPQEFPTNKTLDADLQKAAIQ